MEIPIKKEETKFSKEDELIVRLRDSKDVEDQLTLTLMESHVTEGEDSDNLGLWYDYARAKAKIIMKKFSVKSLDL